MLKGAVSSRYAEALYNVAVQNQELDEVEQELNFIVGMVESLNDFKKILYHPIITVQEKKVFLENVFKDNISSVTKNFLFLLVDHHRQFFLKDILKVYKEYANKTREITQAQVFSAVELNTEEKVRIEQIIQRYTGKKVETTFNVDPSLIGGVILRIGDKIIDGSVRAKLDNLKEHLTRQAV